MLWILKFASPLFASSFMPPQGTAIAAHYDALYEFIVIASTIACIILIGGMIYFVMKYKRKSASDKTAFITHNTFLEFLWSFIPLIIFMAVFVWGWIVYHQMRDIPEDALEVNVIGRQWSWEFLYKSGKRVGREFLVPVNTNVKLVMTSDDVIHSFYIPSMRIKQDVVPGRYTTLWFNAEKLGDYHVFCTEFCGTAHSAMLAVMKVVPVDEYEKWIQENDDALPLAERGAKLYNAFCIACHTTNGAKAVGPTWKGIYGSEHAMTDGSTVLVDDNYLRESILNPQAKIVKGYELAGPGGKPMSSMPAFQGQLTEEQVTSIIEFIKTLK